MGATWDEWIWARDDSTDPALRREIERLGELMIAAANADEAAIKQAQLNVGLAVRRLASMRPWTLTSGCPMPARGQRRDSPSRTSVGR